MYKAVGYESSLKSLKLKYEILLGSRTSCDTREDLNKLDVLSSDMKMML